MKWFRVVASPFIPLVFWSIYTPINELWTVHTLGCGCDPGFNANHFNAILGLFILAASIALLVGASSQLMQGKKTAYLVAGGLLQCVSSFVAWLANLWM